MCASNTSVPLRASVTDTRGGGGLRYRREGLAARAVRVLSLAALILVSGCASPRANESAGVPSTPASEASPSSVGSPSPAATPDVSEQVAAAYERYLDATSHAMETGDGQLPDLLDVAEGQALAAAQARVVALASQDRTARGRLVPSVQEVEINGDTAAVDDCYRADITEHDDESDEEVADRDGARLRATASLRRDGDAWVVTTFKEGEPCVPRDLAEEVIGRYRAFWAALGEAGAPPDPENPSLAEVAAGDQLEGLRSRLREFAEQGYEVRDESVPHPRVVQVSGRDTVAHVRDCRELDPDGGVYDADSGELIDGGARAGQHSLWVVRLELIGGTWKVVDADLAEEDSTCAADT